MEKTSLTLKFDGELHEVNAETFINSLASLVTITKEVNKELIPEERIDINIKTLTPGSFLVNLDLIATMASLVYANNGFQVLGEVIGVIGGLYELRKHLHGEKPVEVIPATDESVNIKNTTANVIIVDKRVYNIYQNNPNVEEALDNTFEALNSNPLIKSFEIQQNGSSIFKADKEEFSKLTSQEKIIDIKTEERIVTIRAFVRVFKIVFDSKYKWEFIYKSTKISANVSDDNFFQKIEKGERFSKGDLLEVELEIFQEFDSGALSYINKGYNIKQVFSHKLRDEQIEIDL